MRPSRMPKGVLECQEPVLQSFAGPGAFPRRGGAEREEGEVFCTDIAKAGASVDAGSKKPKQLAVITDGYSEIYCYWQYWIPLVSDIAFGLSPSAKAGLRLAA